ncbi:hypothetical protein AB0I77_34265 [Streptomyces sp. NPDC050619]|uniref:hypothetical protein n=1 Tax=Streptomyces sp. NPDC050619 TaxID=3157214 RepID=UPI003444B50C
MDHCGQVLAQRQIADEGNEIPAFQHLLGSIDLTDTLHTQHAHSTYRGERGAHPRLPDLTNYR